jgi:hypothetical protein
MVIRIAAVADAVEHWHVVKNNRNHKYNAKIKICPVLEPGKFKI